MSYSKNPISYFERQRFRKWWLLLFLFGINALFISGCIKQIVLGVAWGNNPMNDVSLIILTICIFLLSLYVFFSHLDMEVSREGIYWRFFLLEFRSHFLSWDEIDNYEVSQYDPLSFGGWGIKYKGSIVRIKSINISLINSSLESRKATVYSTSGNYALKLKLKDGRHIFIGTRHPDELNSILNQIHAQRSKK